MSKTRQARRLEALLEQRAAKRLAVTWDQAPHKGHSWQWCVDWCDGPTVEQMQAWAQDVADDVFPLDTGGLYFTRRLSLIAWSVQLVRHIAGGGSLDDRYAVRYLLEELMGATATPDQAADELEARRAKALRRLVVRQESQNGENVVSVGDEMQMLETLRQCGLEVLDLDGALDDLEGAG